MTELKMTELKTFNVAKVQFLESSAVKLYSYRIPENMNVKPDDYVVVSANRLTSVNSTVCKVVGVVDALEDAYSPTRTGKPYEQVIAVIDVSNMIDRKKREERRERLLDLLSAELSIQSNAVASVPNELLEQYRGKSQLIDSLLDAIKNNGE